MATPVSRRALLKGAGWGGLAYLLAGDYAANTVAHWNTTTRLTKYPANDPSLRGKRRAVLYFPGVLADGTITIQPVLSQLVARADVFAVNYDPYRFVVTDVIQSAAHQLWEAGYRDLIVFGQSCGGCVGIDFARTNANQRNRFNIRLITHDAPDGVDTLVPGYWAYLSYLLRPGPLLNLLSPFVFGRFPVHDLGNLGAGADPKLVKAGEAAMHDSFLSCYVDQVRYLVGLLGLVGYQPVQPHELSSLVQAGVAMCSIGVDGDTTVGNDGLVKWVAAHRIQRALAPAGSTIELPEYVRMPHIDNTGYPLEVQEGLERAFARIRL
ncbi:MAG TPA: hypothetical protein VI322_01455 [Candidatus Saccharimonadia bacterium]